MSPELKLVAEHSESGLTYREGGLEFSVSKARLRWEIRIARDTTVLGVDVVNLGDAKARRAVANGLRGATDEELDLVRRVLVGLAYRVDEDWQAHVDWESAGAEARREMAALLRDADRVAANAGRVAALETASSRLLDDPGLLFQIGEAVAAQGVVGERTNVLLMYLAVTSRLTSEPISLFVKGDSSAGKSHLVGRTLTLFPDAVHIDLTSVSEKALIYDARPYTHKTIVFFEAHGQANELVNYLVRTLISEGQIRHMTVERDESGAHVGKEIVKQGPTNFITTTTAPEGHAENETRVWTLLVDDSEEATRGVLALSGRRAAGDFLAPTVTDWQAAQEWLESAGETEVVVPYGPVLASMMPAEPVRMRRDFIRLVVLIKVCAILHQRQRARDDYGRVVAVPADYAMVHSLVDAAFGRVLLGVTEKTTELVDATADLLAAKEAVSASPADARVSYSELVSATRHPKYYISRWLRPAIEIGLLDNTESTRGKAAQLKLGGFKRADPRALPSAEDLAERLGVSFGWIDPITGGAGRAGAKVLHRSSDATGEVGQVFPAETWEPEPWQHSQLRRENNVALLPDVGATVQRSLFTDLLAADQIGWCRGCGARTGGPEGLCGRCRQAGDGNGPGGGEG